MIQYAQISFSQSITFKIINSLKTFKTFFKRQYYYTHKTKLHENQQANQTDNTKYAHETVNRNYTNNNHVRIYEKGTKHRSKIQQQTFH